MISDLKVDLVSDGLVLVEVGQILLGDVEHVGVHGDSTGLVTRHKENTVGNLGTHTLQFQQAFSRLNIAQVPEIQQPVPATFVNDVFG